MAKAKRESLEELAAKYLDPSISVHHSITLYAQMCGVFGGVETDRAIRRMRHVFELIGAKQ